MSWIGDMFSDVGRGTTQAYHQAESFVGSAAPYIEVAALMLASTVAAPFVASVIGPAVTSILGAETAGSVIAGTATVGSVATGAITQAGVSAAEAALTGGDPARAAEFAALGSAVGDIASGAAAGELGARSATGGYSGIPSSPAVAPSLAGSAALGTGLTKGAGALAGTTATQFAGGKPLDAALQQGLYSGATTGISSALAKGLGVEGQGIGNRAAQQALQTGSEKLVSGVTGYSPTVLNYQPQTQSTTQPSAQITSTLPSPTLGQSLSIAPSLGYTPGETVFGSSDIKGDKSKVWNVGSLRNVGSAEA